MIVTIPPGGSVVTIGTGGANVPVQAIEGALTIPTSKLLFAKGWVKPKVAIGGVESLVMSMQATKCSDCADYRF
jgi:hypothetical protein